MKIIVSYQTLQLPPPYSYAYTLDLMINRDTTNVKFEQEYLNRDTLTEDEILNESFTLDDDVKWSGELNDIWADHLLKLFEDVQLQDESDDETHYIHMAIGNRKPGLVLDIDFWDYELQEIVQAVYEAADREKPLEMNFLVTDGNSRQKVDITASFKNRQCWINSDQYIPWEACRKIMSLTFNEEYEADGLKKPNNDGVWVDFDNMGIYYHIPNKATESELIDLIL